MASWKDNARFIDPYIPGEQPAPGAIKLNTNENPYPPSPKVMEAIKEYGLDSLRLYPSAESTGLRKTLAKYFSVNEENVFIGNGSDDVLALSFLSFFNSSLPVIFPDVTYSFYKVWCSLFDIPCETRPLLEDYRINPGDYFRKNGGIVIANPNAPTAIALGLGEIEQIVSKNPSSVVIIDEAYAGFGSESAIPLIKKYDNLLVVQTFSKSRSLAGMRVGAAFGGSALIGILSDVKNSYNSYPVSRLSQAAAEASVNDEEYFRKALSMVIKTREYTAGELKALGFSVTDSSANFLFAEHEKFAACEIQEYLKGKNIYVRLFNAPRTKNRLRITIGTDREMRILLDELAKLFNSEGRA